jgi:hypothetical protein
LKEIFSIRINKELREKLTLKSIQMGIDISELIRRYIYQGLQDFNNIEEEKNILICTIESKKTEFNLIKQKFDSEILVLVKQIKVIDDREIQNKEEEREAEELLQSLIKNLIQIPYNASNDSQEYIRRKNLKIIDDMNLKDSVKNKVINKLSKEGTNYL